MNYNGFNLWVASTIAAMMWASTLSAFYFPPTTMSRRPTVR